MKPLRTLLAVSILASAVTACSHSPTATPDPGRPLLATGATPGEIELPSDPDSAGTRMGATYSTETTPEDPTATERGGGFAGTGH